MRLETFFFARSRTHCVNKLRNTHILLLVLMTFLLLTPLQAGWSQQDHHHGHSHRHLYQKQVEELEQQWRVAQLHGDTATIDRLLADDYMGITSNGILQTKDETLARLRSGQLTFKRLDLTEVKVRVHGITAVVTSRADVQSVQNGIERDGVYRYTRVYQLQAGNWKVVNFEATRINPSAQGTTEESSGAKTLNDDSNNAQQQAH